MTEFQPNALCFGQEFPASGEPCLVQVEDLGITVMFLSGAAEDRSESASFSALTVAAGGFDHDQLVVRWVGAAGERTLYLK
ncbi:MAG: hypothetical protein HP492_10295, partial [Nitrospira sp.]|nr:hypothetical protein [Nitrospira sp.]